MAAGSRRKAQGHLSRPASTGSLLLPEVGDALATISAAARRSTDSLAALCRREEERLKAALSQAADDWSTTAADLTAKRDSLGAAVVLAAQAGVEGASAAASRHRSSSSLRPSTSYGSLLDFAWPTLLIGPREPSPPCTPAHGHSRAAKAGRKLGGALSVAPRLLRGGVGRVRRAGGMHAPAVATSSSSGGDYQEDLFAALERTLGPRFEARGVRTTATRLLAGPAAAAKAAGSALEEAQVTVSDNLAVLGAALARGAGAAAAALPGAEAGWDQAASAAAGPVGRPVGGALAAVSAESSLLPPPLPPGVWRPGRLGGVLSASSAPPYSFPALAPDALLADLPAPLAAAFRVLASPRARGGAQKRRLAEAAAAAAAAAAEGAPPPASTPLEPWWWGGLDTKPPAGPLQTEAARRRAAAAAAARAGISSLRDPARRVAIFTTAALPWMTGTAVNPLLRAAYLSAQDPRREVTLYVPWLAPPDQAVVYPARHRFATPADQAAYVRTWARERTGLPCGFRLEFYPGRYAPEKGSILPVGDLTALSSADVAVLEEPEHLTWYHHGARWADRFAHVVGVVHTNYLDYAAREEGGALKSAALRAVNELVCRVHCHKVVKLSDAVQRLPRETTQFVHGVPGAFLDVGRARAAALAREHGAEAADAAAAPPAPTAPGGGAAAFLAALLPAPPRPAPGSGPATAACFPKGAYFIGKAIWAKGYTELLDLMEQDGGAGGAGGASGRVVAPPAPGGLAGAALGAWARATARAPPPAPAPTPFPSPPPPPPHIDCFGAGDDLPALKQAASARALPLTFHGGRDHLDPGMHGYRVLVNPSTSDVVATTTAEALAMGKWVLVADLPCNAFFAAQFRNCLTYRTPAEFSARLRHALATDPHPLSGEEAAALSWEAATQRFLDATELTLEERPTGAEAATDRALGAAFNALTGLEPLRELVGAGSGTRDAPPTLDGWAPAAGTGGGFFDSKDRLAKAAAVKAAAAAAAGGGGGGGGKKRGKGARLAAAAS